MKVGRKPDGSRTKAGRKRDGTPPTTPVMDHATGEAMTTEEATWAKPCADYTSHQFDHRNRPEGWVCIACHPAVRSRHDDRHRDGHRWPAQRLHPGRLRAPLLHLAGPHAALGHVGPQHGRSAPCPRQLEDRQGLRPGRRRARHAHRDDDQGSGGRANGRSRRTAARRPAPGCERPTRRSGTGPRAAGRRSTRRPRPVSRPRTSPTTRTPTAAPSSRPTRSDRSCASTSPGSSRAERRSCSRSDRSGTSSSATPAPSTCSAGSPTGSSGSSTSRPAATPTATTSCSRSPT